MNNIKNKFPGIHHFYLGIVILLLGFYGLFYWNPNILLIVIIIGLIIIADDIYQHYRQLYDINYHSPLHKLYVNTFGKLKIIRIINQFFDKIFGRK